MKNPSSVPRRTMLTGLAAAGLTVGGATVAHARPAGPPSVGGSLANSQGTDRGSTGAFVNVKESGARGDGRHDDTRAIQRAIQKATQRDAVVFFPAGEYVISSSLTMTGPTVLLGSGMWRSTLRRTTGALIAETVGGRVARVRLEGLCCDGGGFAANLFEIDDGTVHSLQVESCRFTNIVQGGTNEDEFSFASFCIAGVEEALFNDCLWHNPAAHAGFGEAVLVTAGKANGRIVFSGANRFLWLHEAIRVVSGDEALYEGVDAQTEELTIDGGYFDSYWWLLPAAWHGGGSTVSYSQEGLVDTGADFSEVPAGAYPHTVYVRALPVRHQGKVTSAGQRRIAEGGAHFAALGLKRGELIRTGNSFAVIKEVDTASDEAILVEGWLDNESLLPTAPPEPGESYTVFGILLGQILSATKTGLTFDARAGGRASWFDLHGDYSVMPEAGTRYEIMQTRTGYHVKLANYNGVKVARVTNSTFRRSHHDQLSGGARTWQVIGNVFEDGQDVGFSSTTWRDGRQTVIGNEFIHQGSIAVWAQADGAIVTGNRSISAGWRHQGSSEAHYSCVGRRCYFGHNVAAGGSESVNGIPGIALMRHNPVAGQPTGEITEGNVIENNLFDALGSDADIRVFGADVADNHIIGTTSVTYDSGGTAQRITGSGSGSPEGRVSATPGSVYTRTDGQPGATLYVKESGTGSTGWAAK